MRMHLKILFLFLINFTYIGHAQIEIIDPGNYNVPNNISIENNINTDHISLENYRNLPKITSFGLSSNSVTYSNNDNWGDGTWHRGYFPESITPAKYQDWFESDNTYWSCHPMIRHTGRYALGYIHARKRYSYIRQDFEDIMNYALSELCSSQRGDGSYIFWKNRPSKFEPDYHPYHTLNNHANIYPGSIALRALIEGYWYKKQILNDNSNYELPSIIKSADYLHSTYAQEATNSNVKGFAAWALSGAYKVTGDEKYRSAAITLGDQLVSLQSKGGIWDGLWLTGSIDQLPGTSNGPFAFIEKWLAADVDGDGEDEVLQKYYNSNTIYLWDGDNDFGANAIYQGNATIEKWLAADVDNDGRDEVLQKYSGSNHIYLWDDNYNFGANTIYSGNASIEKWLAADVDGDGKDEVIQKYSGGNHIYLWDDNYGFGANTIYSGNATIEKWLAADVDNDGRDEVLQKYSGSNHIYLWDDNYSFGSNTIYTGNATLEKWFAADVDGDDKDEIIHKNFGGNHIYIYDNNYNFGNYNFGDHTIYSGNAAIEKWLAADVDGDGKSEVLQKYNNHPEIYLFKENVAFGSNNIFNFPKRDYYHDTKIAYHIITLRGLVETYSILDCGEKKDIYRDAIRRGINHIIQDRFHSDPSENGLKEYFLDINSNPIPEQLNLYPNYETNVQTIIMLAYYAKLDPEFSSTEINRLLNLAKRQLRPSLIASSYYYDYYEAIDKNEILDYYIGTTLPIEVNSSLDNSNNNWDLQGNDLDGSDYEVEFFLHKPTTFTATTNYMSTLFDTKLEIFNKYDRTSTDLFNDNISSENLASTITGTLGPGYYYIVVEGYNGGMGNFKLTMNEQTLNCSNNSEAEANFNRMKTIQEKDTSIEFNKVGIYPNPTKKYFFIDLPKKDIYDITIINSVTGKLIFSLKSTKQYEEINCENFANGLYIVNIKSNNNVWQEKIIISK